MKKIFKRNASPEEQAWMNDFQQIFEKQGFSLEENQLYNALVYDNGTKYMQQIIDDYYDDRKEQLERDGVIIK